MISTFAYIGRGLELESDGAVTLNSKGETVDWSGGPWWKFRAKGEGQEVDIAKRSEKTSLITSNVDDITSNRGV